MFISYSHADAKWLGRLRVHLKPLEVAGVVDVWDDTRIRAGAIWEQEIRDALADAAVAVLLISADFLASDFVRDTELPALLRAAETDGATVLPIIISPCRFTRDKALSRFQTINAPSRPLSAMSRHEQEELLVKLTNTVEFAVEHARRSGESS